MLFIGGEHMLLKPSEVAKELQVSLYILKQWLRDGKVKGVKVGHLWRIEPAEVERIKREGIKHTE
jgi:excisionase family DNA binding protein